MKKVGEEDKQEMTFLPSVITGRPAGSTATKKYYLVVALKQCKNEIVVSYQEDFFCTCRRLGRYTKKGDLSQLIEAKKKKKLPDLSMMEFKVSLVNLIIKMSQIRRWLTSTQCLVLANDLLSGTKTEKR